MFLDYSEIFLLGAFAIIFLSFITYYLAKPDEKYYLYFAIGCLISIIRTFTSNLYAVVGIHDAFYKLLVPVDHLSFIWGPLLYILLADSLYPQLGKKNITRLFSIICILISLFIIFVPIARYPVWFSYDYYIASCMLYASYIFTYAMIKKAEFSTFLFAANILFVAGITYDLLDGAGIIKSPFGELNSYTYFVFLYLVSAVLAKKYRIVERKHFEAQLKFLNAQIKPHFLYNTINTIRAYSKKDAKKTGEMLDYLSVYLRGKLRREDEMLTSLKEEIELVKSYLALEKVRFEERLEIEYDIDDDIDIIIPCLIIQPIVENAVKHGISLKSEGGKIKIKVEKVDKNVIITVQDNGLGIDEKRIPDILDGRESGIGISNTNKRLKQYYNTKINVSSIKDKGTTFQLTIPIAEVGK